MAVSLASIAAKAGTYPAYVKDFGRNIAKFAESVKAYVDASSVTDQAYTDTQVASGGDVNVDGLNSKRCARGTYDFDVDGGAVSAIGLGVTIPANAIITRAYYEVITVPTSTTSDAATIALSVDSANDIVSALAIADGSNIWDVAGAADTIADGTLATFIEVGNAAKELTLTVAVEPLLTGKIVVFVEYVVSEHAA